MQKESNRHPAGVGCGESEVNDVQTECQKGREEFAPEAGDSVMFDGVFIDREYAFFAETGKDGLSRHRRQPVDNPLPLP